MINNIRRITATDTVPAATAITGAITVSAERNNTVVYTGAVNLLNYITQGNSGGGMGYAYLVCADTTAKVARITGTVQLTNDTITPANNTWAIETDGNLTGASASSFGMITQPLYGFSLSNDGGADVTVNGTILVDGETYSINAPDYADGYNIGETKKPLYVVAGGSSVLVSETLGAPSIA